jgi:acetyl-CoA synthetase
MATQLSLPQITQCGIERNSAIALLSQVNQALASLPAIACWQHLSQKVLNPSHPFALHQLLYQTTFADWDEPAPAWIPTPQQIQATNMAALMADLQMDSYAQLHAWSIRNRAAYWGTLIQRLGIRLQQPYTQILDGDGEFPRWLVDAQLNIVESCFQASENAPAIVFQPEGGAFEVWTYGKLQALTNRVANGLIDMGFGAANAIAIDLPMIPESVAIYLGIIKAGCVVVSIADSFAAAEIATRLRLGQARAIFTLDWVQRSGKQLPLYTKVVEAEAPLAIVLSRHPVPQVKLRSGDLTWDAFLNPGPCFDAVPAQPSAHTNILFSSGTTGEPKAIPWTHTTPIKCAVDAHLHLDIQPGDVVAWSTSLGWMMGPWLIYASLINRATIALYGGTPTSRRYGHFIQDAHVTLLGVVPSLVNIWKTTDCMRGLNWSAIKTFSSTGECSNPNDMLFLMSLAGYKPIVEYCGGTEIGGAYLTGTLVQPCVPATFTTPTLGLDIVILNGNDHPADKGETFLIPPSIGLSTELLNRDHHEVYFADTPKCECEPSVVRRHGDYVERLANGYYRMCGRADDTMNLGGIKVGSAEIERAMNTVEGICETAAISLAPVGGGPSQLIVYAVVAPEAQKEQVEWKTTLQAAIAQHLNPLFKIADVIIVESLPRTASNKVMRRVLREQYRSQSRLSEL